GRGPGCSGCGGGARTRPGRAACPGIRGRRSCSSPRPPPSCSRRSGRGRNARCSGWASWHSVCPPTTRGGGPIGRLTGDRPWHRYGLALASGRASSAQGSHCPSMYRRLDGAHIVATLDLVQRRIEERFPGSGLSQVSGGLPAAAGDSIARAVDLSRPNLPLRIASGLVIVLMVALGVGALLSLKLSADPRTLTDLMQSQAIQNFVFLGVAVVFLASVDTRLKRGRALKALHELRSIAHVVDMHQLAKAPNEFLPGREELQVTPDRRMSRADLARYLDYCTDRLSHGDALWRPRLGRHNIWEIVLHTAYWKYIVRRRLMRDGELKFPRRGSNWPRLPVPADAAAWKRDVALLREEHRLLCAVIAR